MPLRQLMRFLFLTAILVPLTTAATASQPCTNIDPSKSLLIGGQKYGVVVSPNPATVNIGQKFSVTIKPCKVNADIVVTRIDAVMPMHGHGMNYRPTLSAESNDAFRADGMVFHMPGKWRMIIETRSGEKREKLTSDITVMP